MRQESPGLRILRSNGAKRRTCARKVEIPGRGSSSPVVWGDRLFLLTAIPAGVTVGGDMYLRGFKYLYKVAAN